MVQAIFGAFTSLFGGGAAAGTAATVGAAAGTAGAVGTTVGAATSGISVSSILSGAASVLGVVNAISAGNAQADALEAKAADTQAEVPLQTLNGIATRTSIKAKLAQAVGAEDVAYGASGGDLSFGTAAQARKDAFREGDNAITQEQGTEQTNIARLDEQTAQYLKSAARAKSSGLFDGLTIGLKGLTSALNRG